MREESRNLEYKEKITKTFLKTVCAFSNYEDGEIIFGINDNNVIVGIENTINEKLNIENIINDSIKPKPVYTLDVVDYENKKCISLKVKKGYFTPYYYQGKTYKRADTSTVEVDIVELNRLILAGSNINYEELPTDRKDLKFSILEKELIEKLKIKEINEDILKTLNFYTENGNFNIAAELFSDNNKRRFSGIDIIKIGKDINQILFRENLENESILELYFKSIEIYEKNYVYEEIENFERIEKELIPREAFREALANALVHRLWDINANIKIIMHKDKIEITSPGGLPLGISKDEYLNGYLSVLRNPIISSIFYRLRIIEKFGTGIMRIKYEYRESVIKPIFDIMENSIKIILPVLAMEPKNLVNGEKLVYELLNKNIILSRKEIENLTGYTKSKVNRSLNGLLEKNIIEIVGKGRAVKYRLISDI